MPNPTLLIMRLEGPMQSWGTRARWDIRDSADEPTKSGVIGLIGCALGYPMYDLRLADELDANIKMGVRVENKGEPMDDYHTITGMLQTAEGGYKDATIISKRTYLQDASFLVVLEGPDDLLKRIRDALLDPKWPVYLGRKSCIPTRPIFEALTTEYASIEDALKKYPWSAATLEIRSIRPGNRLRCVIEDEHGKLERNDRIQINPARMYGMRRVREITVDMPAIKEEWHVS